MFERVEIRPAYKVVSDAIELEILNGNLSPGAQLPTETELSRQFGLTRHTVREGIRILEQGGLVRRKAGRRLFVVLPSHGELAPRASRTLIMQRVSFRDLWEVALELETSAVRLAADRISDNHLIRLRENIEEMNEAIQENASIVRLDVEFHSIIAEATGNQVLLLARGPMSLLFYPTLRRLFKHPKTKKLAPRRLLEAHRRILDGLERSDSKFATDWMHKHIVDFRRGYDYCGFDIDGKVSVSATQITTEVVLEKADPSVRTRGKRR